MSTTVNVTLRNMAKNASAQAYSPYSTACIGSAVYTSEGKFFSGCNIENSSYGATICAERVAIFKAVSDGYKQIDKIYVYSAAGWPPCGMCRQVLSEFAGPNLEVIIGDAQGNEKVFAWKDIFPMAFTPEHLQHIS